MSHDARLSFIAEGLPLIMSSARGFWEAAQALNELPREASVMIGFAEEEAAKALILIDIVRCPPALASQRIGRIVKKIFYNHLARMIYAQAQSWKPVDISQLQAYVDQERQGHYLEGGMGEYIVPNWSLYQRESTMYADIELHEDGIPQWNDPIRWSKSMLPTLPPALRIAEALEALGVYSLAGLHATSDIWGKVDFVDIQGHVEAMKSTKKLAARLEAEGLVTDDANQDHAKHLYRQWQLPMYNLDFELISVPLEQLEARREAAFWAEVGDY